MARCVGALHSGGEYSHATLCPLVEEDLLRLAIDLLARARGKLIDRHRAEVDARTESVGTKIREGELRKAPYMLIVGDNEAEANQVSVRRHREGDLGAMGIDEFTSRAREEIDRKA